MYISPPIAVPVLLAIGIAAASVLVPPQPEATHVTVSLSAETYDKLVLRAEGQAGPDGRFMTVAQVIDALAGGQKKGPTQ